MRSGNEFPFDLRTQKEKSPKKWRQLRQLISGLLLGTALAGVGYEAATHLPDGGAGKRTSPSTTEGIPPSPTLAYELGEPWKPTTEPTDVPAPVASGSPTAEQTSAADSGPTGTPDDGVTHLPGLEGFGHPTIVYTESDFGPNSIFEWQNNEVVLKTDEATLQKLQDAGEEAILRSGKHTKQEIQSFYLQINYKNESGAGTGGNFNGPGVFPRRQGDGDSRKYISIDLGPFKKEKENEGQGFIVTLIDNTGGYKNGEAYSFFVDRDGNVTY